MKKVLFVLLITLCSLSFAGSREMQVGGFETLVGWNNYTRSGRFESSVGINWALGFTYKKYFDRVKYNAWNTYWHAGTMALVVPYAGVGIDYVTKDWYAGIGTFLIAPQIHFGIMF